MSGYFRYFPKVNYCFGDETFPVLFDNVGLYVDLIDQVKNIEAYYEEYVIPENQRADQVSYILYNEPSYHWTFFLLNDKLRESGWPVSNLEVYTLAEKMYPHWTVTTEDEIYERFVVGDTVTHKTTGATGTILERRLDLGQIIIQSESGNFPAGGEIELDADPTETIVVYSNVKQYLSVHHYEDEDGEWTDIDPLDQSTASLLSAITYLERLQERNNDLKHIRVFKQSAVESVVGEFRRILERGI